MIIFAHDDENITDCDTVEAKHGHVQTGQSNASM